MGLKDRIIPVPGLLHQKCRSRCRDWSERSNNPGARTITQEVPLPLPVPEPLPPQNVVITTVIEIAKMVETLDGRLGKRSVER